jgi:dihydroneopterin aldolase
MKVYIEDLTFDCIIGILDFERVTTQKVIINTSFEYKYTNNQIPKLELGNQSEENFIDYSIVSNEIETIMCEKKFELLEDAIIFLENYLSSKYQIKNLKIKISKPNILKNCIVSLEN